MLERIKIILSFLVAVSMLTFSVIWTNAEEQPDVAVENITVLKPVSENTGTPVPTEEASNSQAILVSVNMGDEIKEMDMEEYLVCVVAGEVYPTYDIEALKAQAVAARTYLMYKINGGGCANGGDICTSYAHCQAYKSVEQMKTQWGENYGLYLQSISDAVYSTTGEVLKYNDMPICALYHSSSVGATEDCVSVFGGNYPYLVSVKTDIDKDNSEFTKEMTFTKAEFTERVNKAFGLSLNDIDIKIISYTAAGRVATLRVGEKSVKATALRTALGLRSTDFTFENSGTEITFKMRGYGHGVGMSQVGAQEMAKAGSTYTEILTHYYTGVTVEKI